MKTKTFLFMGISICLLLSACKSSDILLTKYYPCDCMEEKTVVKELKDEPAYIAYNNLLETLSIELVNKEYVNGHYLIPCDNNLPNNYKKEGLAVYVSGEVISCSERSKPEFKGIPFYTIKLVNIKIR